MAERRREIDGSDELERIVAVRRSNRGTPDRAEASLGERIARAWAVDAPETSRRPSSAHPLEYDERGFPIPQPPSGTDERTV